MLFKILKKTKAAFILLFFGRIGYAKSLGVKIGNDCRIYTTVWGTEPFLITVGNNVTVTSGVKFVTHDGSTCLAKDKKGRRYLYKPITISNNVFIGIDSIIMPGVKIESNVIIGAGSVVTKSIPEGYIVAGVPAKIIGRFDKLKNIMLNEYISDKEINKTLSYKERVLKVTSWEFKPYLSLI